MLTELQKRAAQAIVNIFETGSARGDYSRAVVVPGDPGHLTYGRSQTTLPTGNLHLLVKAYCAAPDAAFAPALAAFLPRLKACDLSLDHDTALRSLLRRAGSDPVMQSVQDAFFDRIYWTPSLNAAASLGLRTALAVAVVYDSTVHGSFKLIRDRTNSQGAPGRGGVSGQDWIIRYIANRRHWLATNERVPLLRKTVYRMDEIKKLVDAGNWDLDLPFLCRGIRIDAAVLGEEAGGVSARLVEERALVLRMPMMQGSDVLEIQQALIRAGEGALMADGVYGPDTERAVRDFQQRRGLTADGIVGPATRSALEAPVGEVIPMAAE